MVPEIESEPDRSHTQEQDRQPRLGREHRGRLEQGVRGEAERPGHEAEAGDRLGRSTRSEAPVEHGIARPDEGGRDRECVADAAAAGATGRGLGQDEEGGTGEAGAGTEEMGGLQPLAGGEAREQDDQERPEIDDEQRLDGRQVPEGEEIGEMITEETAHAQGPRHRRRDERRAQPAPAPDQDQKPETSTQQKCGTGEQERRHAPGQERERGQRGPERDGAEADGRGDRPGAILDGECGHAGRPLACKSVTASVLRREEQRGVLARWGSG